MGLIKGNLVRQASQGTLDGELGTARANRHHNHLICVLEIVEGPNLQRSPH